jgi:hypothetical protein
MTSLVQALEKEAMAAKQKNKSEELQKTYQDAFARAFIKLAKSIQYLQTDDPIKKLFKIHNTLHRPNGTESYHMKPDIQSGSVNALSVIGCTRNNREGHKEWTFTFCLSDENSSTVSDMMIKIREILKEHINSGHSISPEAIALLDEFDTKIHNAKLDYAVANGDLFEKYAAARKRPLAYVV